MEEKELPEEMEGDIVELESEDGETVKFQHVATIDYQSEWYVLFSPVEEIEGVAADEAVIFKLGSDDNGGDVFIPVEDEKLLDAVYDEYVKIMEEEDADWEECGCEECAGHHEGCDCSDKKCDCECGCEDEEPNCEDCTESETCECKDLPEDECDCEHCKHE